MKIFGKVIRGKSKGKELGFPTVNIELRENIGSGLYAGTAKAANITYKAGVFVNNEGTLLEAHLIGFSGDLYGKEIEIEIGEKIRNVINFESEEELKRQIGRDIELICSQA